MVYKDEDVPLVAGVDAPVAPEPPVPTIILYAVLPVIIIASFNNPPAPPPPPTWYPPPPPPATSRYSIGIISGKEDIGVIPLEGAE
jgi:hypothetical protein